MSLRKIDANAPTLLLMVDLVYMRSRKERLDRKARQRWMSDMRLNRPRCAFIWN